LSNSDIVVSELGEVRFRGPYDKVSKSSQDLSNIYEDVYEEIPAYSIDVKTGDFLNKSNVPVLKKLGKKNIQEQIDSYKDDCDVYKILERVAAVGDPTLLNRRVGSFGDFVDLPDNINDFNGMCNSTFDKTKNISKDLLQAAINEKLSKVDLDKVINNHVKAQIEARTKKLNVVKKEEVK
jgi:hypothetical protein